MPWRRLQLPANMPSDSNLPAPLLIILNLTGCYHSALVVLIFVGTAKAFYVLQPLAAPRTKLLRAYWCLSESWSTQIALQGWLCVHR